MEKIKDSLKARLKRAIEVLEEDKKEGFSYNPNSDSMWLKVPQRTRMEYQMSFCRFIATCTILTVSTNLLVFKYYKKHNLRKKMFLGFFMYAITEPLVLTAGALPVLFDPTFSRPEMITDAKFDDEKEKDKLK